MVTDSVAEVGLRCVRPLELGDRAALLALNTQASDRSLYLRFFTLNRFAADAYVAQLLRPASADHQVLVGLIDNKVVGVASYERLDSGGAEIALLVEDRYQHLGIGTELIESLATRARANGVTQFVAYVLAENSSMIKTVRHLGLPTATCAESDAVVMTIELKPSPPADTVAE
jgi:GNAT superfamily N-acetyltransferase